MSAIATLRRLLDGVAAAGRRREFWWRDDDATAPSAALDQLIEDAVGAPLALAVIPAHASDDLLAFCEARDLAVLQHGVSHTNHQVHGKSAELGDARPGADVIAQCVAARSRLAGSAAFLPVMVPPWNRAAPGVVTALPGAGYVGVSMFGASPSTTPVRRIDAHIDPISWRSGRDLHPDATLSAMIAQAFEQDGPIGLMTHHLVHTRRIRGFVAQFAVLVSGHPAAAWMDVFTLFRGQ